MPKDSPLTETAKFLAAKYTKARKQEHSAGEKDWEGGV